MPDSDLTQGDDDLQRLQGIRQQQLSCLFDVDSNLQALSPPPVKAQVRQGSQKRLEFPNHNPIAFNSTTAALEALGSGRLRRNNPGGSQRQIQPPTRAAQTQQQPRLRTQAELATLYGPPQPSQPSQRSAQPPLSQYQDEQSLQGRSVRPAGRQFNLVALCRRVRDFARTQPQEAAKEFAQYVAFVALGWSIRYFAPSPAVVPLVVVLAVLTIVCLFLLRPGWREQGLTACLLLGLYLSGFF